MKDHNLKPFKQALKLHFQSKKLSDEKYKLLSELSKNINPENNDRKNKTVPIYQNRIWTLSASAIAASLIIVISMFNYQPQPNIITAAYNDVVNDSKLNNGFAQQHKDWIAVNQILPVPVQYQVEMSKFCNLDGQKTTHLRIAGLQQGKMHIFFKKGSLNFNNKISTGKTKNMYWKILKSSNDITVIVMYTKDMREHTVTKIINKMLANQLV